MSFQHISLSSRRYEGTTESALTVRVGWSLLQILRFDLVFNVVVLVVAFVWHEFARTCAHCHLRRTHDSIAVSLDLTQLLHYKLGRYQVDVRQGIAALSMSKLHWLLISEVVLELIGA